MERSALQGARRESRGPRQRSPMDVGSLFSLEHKIGIHASPTCVMSFGDRRGAVAYLVGQEFEMEGRVEEAHAAYRRAYQKDPYSAFLLRKLSETSSRLNRLDDAVRYAERALALEPEDQDLRLYLGTLHRFRRDAAAADQVLRDPAGDPISVVSRCSMFM